MKEKQINLAEKVLPSLIEETVILRTNIEWACLELWFRSSDFTSVPTLLTFDFTIPSYVSRI